MTQRLAVIIQAAAQLGVALSTEVKDNAAEICASADLKPLEKKRFLAAAASMNVPRGRSVQGGPPLGDDEKDPFGHGRVEFD